MLKVEQLHVEVGTFQLRGVELELERGEVLGVLGPNGSGKSTFLKSLLNLYPIQNGTVTIDERNVQKMTASERARHMTLLSQMKTWTMAQTVYDLVEAARYAVRTHDAKHEQAIINNVLQQFELSAYKNRPLAHLSGGELQRAYMAKAFAQEVDLILFDEPTTHLDLHYRAQFFEQLLYVKRANKASIVIVHDVNDAIHYCDRVLVLREGSPIAYGQPVDVLTQSFVEQLYEVTMTSVIDPRNGMTKYLY